MNTKGDSIVFIFASPYNFFKTKLNKKKINWYKYLIPHIKKINKRQDMAEDIVVVVVPYRSVIEENLFILINTKFHSILLFCANLYASAAVAAPSRIYLFCISLVYSSLYTEHDKTFWIVCMHRCIVRHVLRDCKLTECA